MKIFDSGFWLKVKPRQNIPSSPWDKVTIRSRCIWF